MRFRTDRVRLSVHSGHRATPASSNPLLRLFSYLLTGLLLVAALAFSAVFFVLLLAAGLLFGIWFWWKSRALRQQMRAMADSLDAQTRAWSASATDHAANAASARQGTGDIIEGVGVRIEDDAPEDQRP